jgi:DNA-binding MarR family transcriptional regulator
MSELRGVTVPSDQAGVNNGSGNMMHEESSRGDQPLRGTRGVKSLQEELHKKEPFALPSQEAYLSIVRTESLLGADFERFFRQFGLSQATFNALRILRGAGDKGRMCHEITKHLVTPVPDVTRLVDRLEKAGLAERHRSDEDRRVIYVRITQLGLERLSEMDQKVLEKHREQLGHMSEGELRMLNDLLAKARSRLVDAEPGPCPMD